MIGLPRQLRDRLPGPLRSWYFRRVEQRWQQRSRQEIFSEIYRDQVWGGGENPSGSGSSRMATAKMRAALPGLVSELKVSTLLDVACGTFSWQSELHLPGVEIVGVDIVPAIVADLERRFGTQQRRFIQLDVTSDPLPRASLVLCRDCLVHLDLLAAQAALANMIRSGIPYLLTTTFPGTTMNHDIVTGFFRPLNLHLPPFGLPAPLQLLDENREGKFLGLWDCRRLLDSARTGESTETARASNLA